MKLIWILMMAGLLIQSIAGAEMIRDVEYARVDGMPLLLDVNMPDEGTSHPVVLVVHGGGWGSGDKRTSMPLVLDALTSGGFTWVSINYRLAPEHLWPACLEDVETAVDWVSQHAGEYRGDPNRLALLGYSAGGHLACLAALRAVDRRVQAVVGLAPPTDFEQEIPARQGLSKSLQNLLNQPQAVTSESLAQVRIMSPLHHVHEDLPPFLLMHGTEDKSVPYVQSVNFSNKLREHGAECELYTIEGAPHRQTEWIRFDADYPARLIEWLQANLAPGE